MLGLKLPHEYKEWHKNAATANSSSYTPERLQCDLCDFGMPWGP